MTNELMEQQTPVSVKFTPSEITIENEQQLDSFVDSVVDKYTNLIFTDETIVEAKKSKTELNKVVKALEDNRKEIKKQFNEPYIAFESKIKDLVSKVRGASVHIDASINEFEGKELAKRENKLIETINEMLPNYNLKANEVVIEQSWLNKGSFTKTGELTQKTLKEIGDTMTSINQAEERKENDIIAVEAMAKRTYRLQVTGTIDQLSALNQFLVSSGIEVVELQ